MAQTVFANTGLVETSTNLASVKPCPTENGALPEKYMVQCSTRSSLGPPLEAVRDSISKLSGLVRGPHNPAPSCFLTHALTCMVLFGAYLNMKRHVDLNECRSACNNACRS